VSDFLDPSAEISKHGHRLPHWQQDIKMQFVTFRLGDSLPEAKVKQWKEERRIWLAPQSHSVERGCREGIPPSIHMEIGNMA